MRRHQARYCLDGWMRTAAQGKLERIEVLYIVVTLQDVWKGYAGSAKGLRSVGRGIEDVIHHTAASEEAEILGMAGQDVQEGRRRKPKGKRRNW